MRRGIPLIACLCALTVASWSATAATLKMATDSGAKGSPASDAIDRWAGLIKDGTNGEVKVEIFYKNEL